MMSTFPQQVRMNMPIDDEGKVHFTTTLFALVRVNLQIFMRSMDEMDQADLELRATIARSWPHTKRDGKLDLLVPPASEIGPNKLTVGKIYGGMLILENWKLTRFSELPLARKLFANGDAAHPTITDLMADMQTMSKNHRNTSPRPNGGPNSAAVDGRRKTSMSSRTNDRVQDYINSLEPMSPEEEDAAAAEPAGDAAEEEERRRQREGKAGRRNGRRPPPRTFPRPIEPLYENVPRHRDYPQRENFYPGGEEYERRRPPPPPGVSVYGGRGQPPRLRDVQWRSDEGYHDSTYGGEYDRRYYDDPGFRTPQPPPQPFREPSTTWCVPYSVVVQITVKSY
jgi:hypothetical protein